MDVLREARYRRWVIALGGAITLVLLTLALTLRMDVVDGALASTRLFGHVLGMGGEKAEVVLRPVFGAAAFVIFYGGLLFGIVGCSDFAPRLLAPGRIEPLLALPVRRWELIAGTFLGVLALSVTGALYGAGGLMVLGAKTGIWSLRPVAAALLAAIAFAAIYSTMLATAVFARSAAAAAAVGSAVFAAGIISSYRAKLAPLFKPGWGRSAFEALSSVVPRIATLGNASVRLASSAERELSIDGGLLVGFVLFTLGSLAVGVWKFEQKDF
jgi:Cu-processing system permease protein